MKKATASNYFKKSEELYYPSMTQHDAPFAVSDIDEPIITYEELKRIYLEAQEYDFLVGKIPGALPDYLNEED